MNDILDIYCLGEVKNNLMLKTHILILFRYWIHSIVYTHYYYYYYYKFLFFLESYLNRPWDAMNIFSLFKVFRILNNKK